MSVSQEIVEAIKQVNLEAITVKELTLLIRQRVTRHNQMSIVLGMTVAYALKEAYRLGQIRGRALK